MFKKRGQGITRVSDLFKKYKETLTAPQGAVIKAFKEVVQEQLGIDITEGECTYSVTTKTLMFRGSGMIKSEILLHKQTLLNMLETKLGKKSAPREIL